MKRSNVPAILIALVLFVIPFFWMKPGYVDMGGDAGRLYFLDPSSVAKNTYGSQLPTASALFDMIPYELYLSVLKNIIPTATALIATEHGLQLSLSFLFIYLTVQTLLVHAKRGNGHSRESAGLTAGLVYVGFISVMGWVTALPTLGQVFLNPLIFYLLLQFCLNASFRYVIVILFITIIYSGSFGFSAMPQLMSFYPLALLFLLITMRFVFHRKIPWQGLGLSALAFVGLHAFHIVPFGMSLISKDSFYHTYIFAAQSIGNSGVRYFAANHEAQGKISTQLFQPVWPPNIFVLIVPFITLWGCIKSRSKLTAIAGIFFLLTLFFVSANITKLGVSLYQQLFYIPGFMMFRSFNEKWYGVFAFFYTLFFAFSLNELIRIKRRWFGIVLVIAVIGSTVWRIYPFLTGKPFESTYYQSNVSREFTFDPNLLDAVSYVRSIPGDSRFLTLPLTFPYYQIAYGIRGGAYVGISLISELDGKVDYPGFLSFGAYEKPMFDAIHDEDFNQMIKLLFSLNVRYVFYNSDPRIIDNFPDYPYIYPGYMYSSKDQLPAIKDQAAYKKLLAKLPLKKIYERGYYSIYEVMYPTSRIPVPLAPHNVTEQRYIVVGRFITIVTFGLCILFFIYEIVWKRHDKA